MTSLDYMRLLSWIAAYKCGVILSRTQMQKILYICYGVHLASKNNVPFDDDKPQAWPFGPVFPRVYKRYREEMPAILLPQEQARFIDGIPNLPEIFSYVQQFCHLSASQLSNWSHQVGGPWWKALQPQGGNKPKFGVDIDRTDIINFFQGNWKEGLIYV